MMEKLFQENAALGMFTLRVEQAGQYIRKPVFVGCDEIKNIERRRKQRLNCCTPLLVELQTIIQMAKE